VVGAGIIGRNHAAAILRHPRLRVAAVVDPDESARTALVDTLGGDAAQFGTLTAALAADAGIDLVAICTPSGLHAEDAELALTAGRHVFVEKPLVVSLPGALRLARLAARAEQPGPGGPGVSRPRVAPGRGAAGG